MHFHLSWKDCSQVTFMFTLRYVKLIDGPNKSCSLHDRNYCAYGLNVTLEYKPPRLLIELFFVTTLTLRYLKFVDDPR
jgi:hypothetical protein